jgi:hypothetical protein
VQAPEETLSIGSPAPAAIPSWLLVQVARHLGLAARFVSGYLIQLKPDLEGARRSRGHRQGLHRSARLGGGLCARRRLDRLRCDLGPAAARAISRWRRRRITAVGGADHRHGRPAEVDFAFDMRVDRIARASARHQAVLRRTWVKLDALGERVDADLRAGDVRLTMGGEPTFVSIDDFESAEWNTAAVGPTKRALADTLIRKLRDRFAPGGFLHYGQGKWYPGESLPRWAFSLYWRKDGEADLARCDADRARRQAPRRRDAEQAEKFTGDFADRLGVGPSSRFRPSRIRPSGPQRGRTAGECRSDRLEARRSGNPRAHGAGVRARPVEAVGLRAADPALARAARPDRAGRSRNGSCGAAGCSWCRATRPVGFRLPLGALPWVPPARLSLCAPAGSDRAARAAAGAREQLAQIYNDGGAAPPRRPFQCRPARTRIEQVGRGGRRGAHRDLDRAARRRLCVFMPPVERLEDYLELLAAIEERARDRNAGSHRRLSAAARSAAERHQGDARSRRDRGECPSGVELARKRSRSPTATSTRKRGRPGSAPTSS